MPLCADVASCLLNVVVVVSSCRRVPPEAAARRRRRGLRQICAGLGAVHARGVLHRDLKPANIMVNRAGRPQLMDFGIATAGGASGAGVIEGTPAYMAPEQRTGGLVSVQSDIYALGLVMHEIFTGVRAPREGCPA